MKWHMHVQKCALTRGPHGVEKKAGLVTLCMTFSERELIPSYNRLRGRYGKLLHRYLSCLGDHQSTGADGDATVLKGECVCVCIENCSFLSQVSLINKYYCIMDVQHFFSATLACRIIIFFPACRKLQIQFWRHGEQVSHEQSPARLVIRSIKLTSIKNVVCPKLKHSVNEMSQQVL